MAFSASNFKRINVGDKALYLYTTTDAIAAIAGSGYFNNAYAEVEQGTVIIAVDTDQTSVDLLAVSSATGATTVTVVNGT